MVTAGGLARIIEIVTREGPMDSDLDQAQSHQAESNNMGATVVAIKPWLSGVEWSNLVGAAAYI